MTTTGQQALKTKVFQKMAELLGDDDTIDLVSNEIGYVPNHFSELMAEAAFNILMAIKDTNDYHDENEYKLK